MIAFITDWTSFRYCPKCGSGDMQFNGKKLFCRACGFTYFFNTATAVCALIQDTQGRLLVVTRAQNPGQGTLDLPGGFVDPGETTEQALHREIQEELGVNITHCQYFASAPNTYPYRGVKYPTCDNAFQCQIDHPECIQATDDISDAQFIAPNDIIVKDFGMRSIQKIVAQFLQKNLP